MNMNHSWQNMLVMTLFYHWFVGAVIIAKSESIDAGATQRRMEVHIQSSSSDRIPLCVPKTCCRVDVKNHTYVSRPECPLEGIPLCSATYWQHLDWDYECPGTERELTHLQTVSITACAMLTRLIFVAYACMNASRNEATGQMPWKRFADLVIIAASDTISLFLLNVGGAVVAFITSFILLIRCLISGYPFTTVT